MAVYGVDLRCRSSSLRSPTMTEPTPSSPTRLPPRWVIRSVWIGHRTLVRVTGTRVGLARPTPGGRFGMLRLTTVGRKTGQAARGHARLHRGRPEPRDPGHERLGVPGAGLVAQPPGQAGRDRRDRRRPRDRSTVGPRSARSASACGRPSRPSAASATTSTRSRAGGPARRPSSSWSHAPADVPAPPVRRRR